MYSAHLDSPMDVLEFFGDVHSFIDEALNNGKNVMAVFQKSNDDPATAAPSANH